jgi:hypothetical protein
MKVERALESTESYLHFASLLKLFIEVQNADWPGVAVQSRAKRIEDRPIIDRLLE